MNANLLSIDIIHQTVKNVNREYPSKRYTARREQSSFRYFQQNIKIIMYRINKIYYTIFTIVKIYDIMIKVHKYVLNLQYSYI